MKRPVLALLGAIVAYFALAFASVWLTYGLYSLNAPEDFHRVQNGWSLELWISEVAGGVVGSLAAFGFIIGNSVYCRICGGAMTAALLGLLVWIYVGGGWNGWSWAPLDLLALPLLIAAALCAWGFRLKRR